MGYGGAVGDPTVFLWFYGLALAPLGMGALSLPVRWWAGRLPWLRALKHLERFRRAAGFRAANPTPVRVDLEGVRAGVPVRVSCWHDGPAQGPRNVAYRVDVALVSPPVHGLVVESRSLATLSGPPDWLWAVVATGIFSETEGHRQHVQLDGGVLSLSSFGPPLAVCALQALVDQVVSARAELDGRSLEPVLRRLARRARLAGHRRRCLETYLRRRFDRRAIWRALRDADADVRLVAASAWPSSPAGRAELRRQLAEPGDEDRRLRALRATAAHAPDLLDELWERLLTGGPPRLAERAVEAARELGRLEQLADLVRNEMASVEARVAALERLEQPDEPVFETLCRQLLHEPVPQPLRLAAVDALGRVGAPQTVGLLRRLGAEAPLHSDLFIACRAAVDLIQARCSADMGALSLIEGRSSPGSLSLPAPSPSNPRN